MKKINSVVSNIFCSFLTVLVLILFCSFGLISDENRNQISLKYSTNQSIEVDLNSSVLVPLTHDLSSFPFDIPESTKTEDTDEKEKESERSSSSLKAVSSKSFYLHLNVINTFFDQNELSIANRKTIALFVLNHSWKGFLKCC